MEYFGTISAPKAFRSPSIAMMDFVVSKGGRMRFSGSRRAGFGVE
jgi:hypothetical protein